MAGLGNVFMSTYRTNAHRAATRAVTARESESGITCGAFEAVLVLTYRASALQIGLERIHPEAKCASRNFAKKGNSWLLAQISHNYELHQNKCCMATLPRCSAGVL